MALAIGAHSLVYHEHLEGVSPLSTSGLTTQASGSTFLLFALTLTGNFSSISDNKGNSYTQVGTTQLFWGDGAEMRVFCCIDGDGGSNHIFSLTKTSPDLDFEATLMVVEVTGGATAIDDYAQAYSEASPLTAGNVTTTADDDMLILAAGPEWEGNNTPSSGYTELEDLNTGDAVILATVASRLAGAAGSWGGTITNQWEGPGPIFLIALKAGSSAIAGTVSAAAAAKTASATGQGAIAGTGAVVSAAATASGECVESVQGAGDASCAAATLNGSGSLNVTASAAAAAAPATAVASGDIVLTGAAEAEAAAASVTGVAQLLLAGAAAAYVAAMTTAATGSESAVATLTASTAATFASATGAIDNGAISCAVSAQVAGASASAVAAEVCSGALSAAVGAASLGTVATESSPAAIAASSSVATASAAGLDVASGAVSASASSATASVSGVQVVAGAAETATSVMALSGTVASIGVGAASDVTTVAQIAAASGDLLAISTVEASAALSVATMSGAVEFGGIWGSASCEAAPDEADVTCEELQRTTIVAVGAAFAATLLGTGDEAHESGSGSSAFYERLAALASRLLGGSGYGQVVRFSRYAPSVVSSGGGVSKGAATLISSANVVQLPIALGAKEFGQDKRVMDDVLASKEVRFLCVAAASMTFEPAPFDEVALAASTWRVTGVTAVNPAGTALVYQVAMVRL